VGYDNEYPQHEVTVPSFEAMKTEVTVGMYRACVDAGVCSEPSTGSYFTSASYNWNYMDREDHPINGVSWYDARTFAQWVGGDLPSESMWEYMARSRGQDITYPWGNNSPTCNLAVFHDGQTQGNGCGEDRTWPVCSKPAGNSDQDLCDLSGNVREWVLDLYVSNYNNAPTDGTAVCDTPICGLSTSNRLVRGGGWDSTWVTLRAAFRNNTRPSGSSENLGFRVCRTTP
jgi:formylglycine-generating enzyme required for sulfatase activity